ncbi:hypothetical protein LQ567_16430 [Niabella pedocola]|uniref:Restriction endonuclease type IV Mrr domain-containing protein n=1 Tax=Niabella pedocola TaxID=1752077 RepID=A0ABS8PTG6_9BACT|nr:hypothetical protein [Niabella pedocola]MCD2424368.1 hypothetical protein [Niabella pedocola]
MAKYPQDTRVEVAFETFVLNSLKVLSFDVQQETHAFSTGYRPDLVIKRGEIIAHCEIKYYRSRRVNTDVILSAAATLAAFPIFEEEYRLLIVSCILTSQLKSEIQKAYGVIIWDRSNLANFLAAAGKDDYLEDFGSFLMQAQQGIDIEYPYDGVDENTDPNPLSYFGSQETNVPVQKISRANDLIEKLNDIALGTDWKQFEDHCALILKYLFEIDLSGWVKQQRTDDGLSRFDLICKINSQDDFWRTLVQAFRSRYVLFEFKNYSSPIDQGQIYTTERYLYPTALRGSAIIITRRGGHENAIAAAKGALRESGKLILLLDENDLIEMIKRKERGDSPSDYLSDILDNHLISIAR